MNVKVKIIPPEIEEKLSLANTYKILNSQLDLLLSDKERSFVREVQEFCVELEPKIDFKIIEETIEISFEVNKI